MVQPHPIVLLGLMLTACTPESDSPRADEPLFPGCADVVVDAPGHTGEGFHDATLATNGVRGKGTTQGGTDVFSLGLDLETDAWMVLAWSSGAVFDGPGPDLAVFENPFDHISGRFFDPVVVEVSADGETWVAFEHNYAGDRWTSDPSQWTGFAGLTPVLLNEDTNPVDPFDSEVAGGDAFDLADLPSTPEADDVLAQGVWFVRLTSAGALIDPAADDLYPNDPIANGADIDGVYGRFE